ncbi:hypothetical protein TNCV_2436931 [Trichonephila clavipes]|nr:hypothetical protein TNCV_2436931 [Trichonephila clavipes]
MISSNGVRAGFTASAHAENEGVNELLRHCCPFVLQRQSKLPESLLVVLVPIHCLSNSGVPGTTENAFSDGQALKVLTVQGVVQTDHYRAVFWPR